MKSLILAIALTALATAAQAGWYPDSNGCYHTDWFYPWWTGTTCSHPALGDPDHTAPVPSAVGQPPKEHCHYKNAR